MDLLKKTSSGYVLIATLCLIILLSGLTMACLSFLNGALQGAAAYFDYYDSRKKCIQSFLESSSRLEVPGVRYSELARASETIEVESLQWQYYGHFFEELPEVRAFTRSLLQPNHFNGTPRILDFGGFLLSDSLRIEGLDPTWHLPYGSYFVLRPKLVHSALGWIAVVQWAQPYEGGWKYWLEWRGLSHHLYGRKLLSKEGHRKPFNVQALSWDATNLADGLLVSSQDETILINFVGDQLNFTQLGTEKNLQTPKIVRSYQNFQSYLIQVKELEPKVVLTPISSEGDLVGPSCYIDSSGLQSEVLFHDDRLLWVIYSEGAWKVIQADLNGKINPDKSAVLASTSGYRDPYFSTQEILKYDRQSELDSQRLVFSSQGFTVSCLWDELNSHGLSLQEREISISPVQ